MSDRGEGSGPSVEGADPPLEGGASLTRLSAMARAVADEGAAHGGHVKARWNRFVAARAGAAPARRRRTAAVMTAALVGIGVALVVSGTGVRRGDAPALTYAVSGGTVSGEGYVARVQSARADVNFSDGTRVTLSQGARAWVVSTDAHGGRIRLEEGRGRFSVAPRPRARWAIEAGPFTIDVTGTLFEVRWVGGEDRFDVHLLSGSVTLRGPLTGGGMTLQPGQRFTARLSEGAARIENGVTAAVGGAAEDVGAARPTPGSAPTPAVKVPSARAGGATVAPGRNLASSRATSAATEGPAGRGRGAQLGAAAEVGANRGTDEGRAGMALGEDWRRLVAGGAFRAVLDDAEQAGIDSCLATLPSDRLAALADAARYDGRAELARRALTVQRERFVGSAASRDAAFLLGRLTEDAGGALPQALEWYDRYLSEAPSGAYAAEALGRKMVAVRQLSGDVGSRAVAREYLRRHPEGLYVAQALEILHGEP